MREALADENGGLPLLKSHTMNSRSPYNKLEHAKIIHLQYSVHVIWLFLDLRLLRFVIDYFLYNAHVVNANSCYFRTHYVVALESSIVQSTGVVEQGVRG